MIAWHCDGNGQEEKGRNDLRISRGSIRFYLAVAARWDIVLEPDEGSSVIYLFAGTYRGQYLHPSGGGGGSRPVTGGDIELLFLFGLPVKTINTDSSALSSPTFK